MKPGANHPWRKFDPVIGNGTATHFLCGHPRSAENTFDDLGRKRCKECLPSYPCGHLRTYANTYMHSGGPHCVECMRISRQERYELSKHG